MAQIKLQLQDRDDDNLRGFTNNHIAALDGNADFPGPHEPTAAVFDAAAAAFAGALDRITELETEIAETVRFKNEKRAELETLWGTRGTYIQNVSGGVESKIVGAGLSVRASATPTTSLPMVENLKATMGDDDGEVDLSWDRLKGARGFQVEHREHVDGTAWVRMDVPVTASRCTVPGLTPGKVHAFRVRALGPKQITGPWSDEAVKMAP